MKPAQWFADANFIGPAELPTLIKVSTTAPGMEREEVQRIAHLVAAAPALLDALQTIADSTVEGGSINKIARAAIAQALEGQQ